MSSLLLNKIWSQQKKYNSRVRALENYDDKNYWTEKYLLGLISEVDEILAEIKWKRHRRNESSRIRVDNIGLELADVFKYALCLFELWGFSLNDMLEIVSQKSDILDYRMDMEFKRPPDPGTLIAIVDMDGVIADLDKSFLTWVKMYKGLDVNEDQLYHSTKQDRLVALTYPDYSKLKEEFEMEGGYRSLYPYDDAVQMLYRLRDEQIYVIMVTARPASRIQRIFFDTFTWLDNHGVPFNELRIEDDDRIVLADKLQKENRCKVVLFEDHPDTIARASRSGVKVIAREQPYNASILPLPGVRMFKDFSTLDSKSIFEEG